MASIPLSQTSVIVKPDALRIVLFGLPDAGKTSLLGALAHAANHLDPALGGKLVDDTQRLSELQRRVYEDRPRPTAQEIALYPVTLHPLPPQDDIPTLPHSLDAVLIDCDGRVVNELLSRQEELVQGKIHAQLASHVLAADTLVLVVDASTGSEALNRDFTQFAHFLRLLEQSRGQRAEVGGLPVYLVLTKCDQLAGRDDTLASWIERIEERKRTVDRKFQEFLAQQGGGKRGAFGKIDLHLWATAVRRPALGDGPARSREPYGVAELFRQCLDSAAQHKEGLAHAHQRLTLVVGGLAVLAFAMLLLATYFYAEQQLHVVSPLEGMIRDYRSSLNVSPQERYRDPVTPRIEELRKFEKDPEFPRLSEELRKYVQTTLQDLKAYDQFNKDFYEKIKDPRLIRTEDELTSTRENLQALKLPPEYEKEWSQTRVGKRREPWLKEVKILEKEASKANAQLTALLTAYLMLDKNKPGAAQFRREAEKLLQDAQRQLYREENRHRLLPESRMLTYGNVLDFERVAEQSKLWDNAATNLRRRLQQ